MHVPKATNILGLLLVSGSLVMAQDDVDQCALDCIANVNGTSCAQAQWSCLCGDKTYVERVNNCTYASCDKADEDTTFGAIAQICQVFGYTLTYGPEATASTGSDQIFSTQGILSASTLPSVLSSTISDSPTGSDGYTVATAPPTPTSSGTAASTSMLNTTSLPSTVSNSASAAAATSSGGSNKNNVGMALALLVGANVFIHC